MRPVWLDWREQEAPETEASMVMGPRTFLTAARTVALSLSEVGAIAVWGRVRT